MAESARSKRLCGGLVALNNLLSQLLQVPQKKPAVRLRRCRFTNRKVKTHASLLGSSPNHEKTPAQVLAQAGVKGGQVDNSTITQAASDKSRRHAKVGQRECHGRMRGHHRGLQLEAILLLQRVGTKHGGIVWYSAAGLARELDCSTFWAREIFKLLEAGGWLLETVWKGRPAHRVLSHSDWAKSKKATQNCSLRNPTGTEQQSCAATQETCGKAQESCAESATKLRGGSNSEPSNSRNVQDFSETPVGSESLKKHSHKYSQQQTARAKPTAAAAAFEDKTFQQAKDIYQRIAGRGFGSIGSNAESWARIVSDYGGDCVVRAVEIWAGGLTTEFAATIRNPVALFLKQCGDPLDAAAGDLQPEKPEPGAELVEVCGEMVPRATAAHVREQYAEMERRKRQWREQEIERRLDESLRQKYGIDFPPPGPDFDRECEEARQAVIEQMQREDMGNGQHTDPKAS